MPDVFDFMTEGGDELVNSVVCPQCGEALYLDQPVEWIDEEETLARCPRCGGAVKMGETP